MKLFVAVTVTVSQILFLLRSVDIKCNVICVMQCIRVGSYAMQPEHIGDLSSFVSSAFTHEHCNVDQSDNGSKLHVVSGST